MWVAFVNFMTALFARLRLMWSHAHDHLVMFVTSLTGQLVFLTLGFVLVLEVILLIPSMASFQYNWLSDRMAKAEIASLAIEASNTRAVTREVSQQLLESAGVTYLAIQNDGVRELVLRDPNSEVPIDVTDLRRTHSSIEQDIIYIVAPWKTLLSAHSDLIHYQARPRVRKGELIEVVVPLKELKDDLKAHLLSILRVSLGISAAAGLMVFYGLLFAIVRPIKGLTTNITRFKLNPEDRSLTTKPSGRKDEIGQIESELYLMQEEVRHALSSRARLAALGQAVSKINHDLRNMLTSAQMASERLSHSDDPMVAKALPRLERALDRALGLAQNVLNYGRSDEAEPVLKIVRLRDLAVSAAEDAGLVMAKSAKGVRFSLKAARGFSLEVDPDQLHRLLVNMMRNARQAIERQPKPGQIGRVTLEAILLPAEVILRLSDNGPGIAVKLKDKLFQPFAGTSTPGGTGLGLAIARELAKLHGGDVILVSTGPKGSVFEISFPQRV